MKAGLASLPDTVSRVSAFSSATVVKAAQKQIKEKIKSLEEEIRIWKGQLNTLSNIARLPPEILSTIFKCVVSDVAFSEYNTMGWVKVTHVCARWRRVALECPSLWTNIPFSYPRWAEEMLARSKMAPLTIVTNLPTNNPRHMKVVQVALRSVCRIQNLSLGRDGVYERKLLENLLGGLVEPAPLLESFSASHRPSKAPAIQLPQHLFSGEAPRLRELDLRGCLPAWDMPILHLLTSLKMSLIPLEARPSMNQIITALSCMPDLQILELCDILPSQGTPGVAAITGPELIISLPNLTQLRIVSGAPEGEFLLNHVSYPPTASITLTFTVGFESTVEGALHSLPSLRGFYKVLGKSPTVRCLTARYLAYPRSIQLMTYDLPGTCLEPPRNAQVNLTLKLMSPFHTSTFDKLWTDMIEPLWTSIPLKGLESLHVIHTRSQDWSHIFTSLATTKLKRLRVSGGSGINFLRAFSPDAPAPQTGQTKRRIGLKIPALRELAIDGWLFDEDGTSGTCAELLKICLEDRRKRKAGIRELFLTECRHAYDEDVGALEKSVKKMSWDGFENITSEEESTDLEAEFECYCGYCGMSDYDESDDFEEW